MHLSEHAERVAIVTGGDAGLREHLLQPTGAHILANRRLEHIRDGHGVKT
jgi:hypothetical protein